MVSIRSLLAMLLFVPVFPLLAQTAPDSLANDALVSEQAHIREVLVGPGEYAFDDILTDVQIVRDELSQSHPVYDIVVYYDPLRFDDPHAGIYPLAFEDQFIVWGQRIALFTQRTSWSSGRFFLCDISTSRQAWILTRDARGLGRLPSIAQRAGGERRLMTLVHAIDGRTDLRTMGRWLRLMIDESREICQQRRRRAAAAARDSIAAPP